MKNNIPNINLRNIVFQNHFIMYIDHINVILSA